VQVRGTGEFLIWALCGGRWPYSNPNTNTLRRNNTVIPLNRYVCGLQVVSGRCGGKKYVCPAPALTEVCCFDIPALRLVSVLKELSFLSNRTQFHVS
jgi:hypothetical protein